MSPDWPTMYILKLRIGIFLIALERNNDSNLGGRRL